MDTTTLILIVFALAIGLGIGYFLRKSKVEQLEKAQTEKSEHLLQEANSKAKEMLLEAKNEAFKALEESKREEEKKREYIDKIELKLIAKEESLEQKLKSLEDSKVDLEKKTESVKLLKEEAERLKEMQQLEIEKIAQLSKEEAKALLLKEVEEKSKEELARQILKAEQELKIEAKERAKFIIADAIQKYAAETATESTATVVALPSDDMKGRIIGREGRNINAFEQATGIDVIIDDTQGSIVISGFDLVRRYVAKVALEKLLQDGRIHPARIEEVVEKTKEEVAQMVKELGEKAAYDVGVAGLHPNLIKLLGRLKFRTSHGQNVLKHSMEVAFLATAMAAELGADASICKKAGLLHDIGKAVDHEIQGHHANIGRDICKKFDLPEAIIHAVEAHEGEIEPKTLEAMIVNAANAIANARPGAQRDNLDNYIKRLEELENTANSFSGVESTYAVQAGSEVRIFVKPLEIDDYDAVKLSYNVARKIERDLQYPGQIKVNVIRETRADDFAT